MAIRIDTSFTFSLPRATDVLLQFEAAAIPEQVIGDTTTRLSASEHCARVPAQDGIGERIWIRASGDFEVSYSASVEPRRQLAELQSLDALAPHVLPGEAVKYLFDSRYCPAAKFQSFAEDQFGASSGGKRVTAILEWIAENFTYQSGFTDSNSDAIETFVERRGVCRDYTHMLVTLARASTIPARYVACYAPGVDPQDFHAIAEVFLTDPETPGGGTWQMVDATGMADPSETVKIGVGRDAADVSFLTSFGESRFGSSSVKVTRVSDE